MANRHSDILGY